MVRLYQVIRTNAIAPLKITALKTNASPSFADFAFQLAGQAIHLLYQAIQPLCQGHRGFCAVPTTHSLEIYLALQLTPIHRIGKAPNRLINQYRS